MNCVRIQTSICLLLACLAGCTASSDPRGARSTGGDTAVVAASGEARWPQSGVSDWVSYGDAAVIGTVTSERRRGPSQEEVEVGEGLIGRDVVVRVDHVVWQHPSALQPPETFTYGTVGWSFKAGADELPMSLAGREREEIGRTYLLVLTRASDEGWVPSTAPLEFDGDRVLPPPGEDDSGPLNDVIGADSAGLRELFGSAQPDPIAEANRHLDPDARYEAVVSAGEPPGSSTPDSATATT